LQKLRVAVQTTGNSRAAGLFYTGEFGCGDGSIIQGGDALIELVDLQHLRDGRNAGDRLFGEGANAVADCAQHLAVDIDRAAAHSGDHAGELRLLAPQADQDQVALWAQHVFEHTEHLDLHSLRLSSLEHRVSHAFHAGANLVHGHDFGRRYGLRLGWAIIRANWERPQKGEDEESEKHSFFHTTKVLATRILHPNSAP